MEIFIGRGGWGRGFYRFGKPWQRIGRFDVAKKRGGDAVDGRMGRGDRRRRMDLTV